MLVLGLGLVSPAVAATRTVTVDSFFFEDDSRGDGRIVVDQGDKTSFQFQGNNQHSATVDGLFDSGVKQGGQSFTTGALTRAGTYVLYCSVHGPRQHGSTLIVRAGAGQPSSPAPKPSSAKPTPTAAKTTAAPRVASGSTAGTSRAKAAAPKPAASTAPSPSASPPAAARSTAPAKAKPATSTAPSPSARTESQASADDRNEGSSRNWLLLVAGLLLLGGGAYALSRRSRTV